MNKDRLRTLRRNVDRGIFVRKEIRELIEWANRRIDLDAKFSKLDSLRTAAGLRYLDVAKKADVAIQTIVNVERMPQIVISEKKVKGAVTPDVLNRLIAVYEKLGFKLTPGTDSRPARVERIK